MGEEKIKEIASEIMEGFNDVDTDKAIPKLMKDIDNSNAPVKQYPEHLLRNRIHDWISIEAVFQRNKNNPVKDVLDMSNGYE